MRLKNNNRKEVISVSLTLSLPPFILKLYKSLFRWFESRGSVVDVVEFRFDRIDASCSDISFKNAIGSVFWSLLLSSIVLLVPLSMVSSTSLAGFEKRLLDEPGETGFRGDGVRLFRFAFTALDDKLKSTELKGMALVGVRTNGNNGFISKAV